jgi:hypothetical protein
MTNLRFIITVAACLWLGCQVPLGGTCVNSTECESGLCLDTVCASEDQAKVAAEIRCRESKACKMRGRCSASQSGHCAVASNKDCKQSSACRQEGLCAAKGQTCVAASNEHCGLTELCKQGGRCTARDGVCLVGGNEDCAKIPSCPPACTAVGNSCRVASDEDCARTVNCKMLGRCHFQNDDCVAVDNKDCVEPCKNTGRCVKSADQPVCVARDDRDCKRSAACDDKGLCRFDAGGCVAERPPEEAAPDKKGQGGDAGAGGA